MITYFTFRPMYLGNTISTPGNVFARGFAGMNIAYTAVAGDNSKDGRYLGMWEYTGDIPESEVEGVVAEALASYSYHQKTDVSATAFLTKIKGRYQRDEDGIIKPMPHE